MTPSTWDGSINGGKNRFDHRELRIWGKINFKYLTSVVPESTPSDATGQSRIYW